MTQTSSAKIIRLEKSLAMARNKYAVTKARLDSAHAIIDTYQQTVKVLTNVLEATRPQIGSGMSVVYPQPGDQVVNMQQWAAKLDEESESPVDKEALTQDGLENRIDDVWNEGYTPVGDDFIPGTALDSEPLEETTKIDGPS